MKNNKKSQIISSILVLLFIINLVNLNAQTYKQGDNIDIIIGSNQTDLNITIQYPNSSIAVNNKIMTKNSNIFNYTFSNTDYLGDYRYIYCSTNNICNQDYFSITGTGSIFNLPRVILSLGILFIFIFIFLVNVSVIPLVPTKDNRNEEGALISINHLKYIRPILYVTSYLFLTIILFISSNLSFAYLGTTLIGKITFAIYYIMMALAVPMLILWFIYIFYSIFQDNKLKQYIERGLITDSPL